MCSTLLDFSVAFLSYCIILPLLHNILFIPLLPQAFQNKSLILKSWLYIYKDDQRQKSKSSLLFHQLIFQTAFMSCSMPSITPLGVLPSSCHQSVQNTKGNIANTRGGYIHFSFSILDDQLSSIKPNSAALSANCQPALSFFILPWFRIFPNLNGMEFLACCICVIERN